MDKYTLYAYCVDTTVNVSCWVGWVSNITTEKHGAWSSDAFTQLWDMIQTVVPTYLCYDMFI